ncbi:MAG: DMT family transporter, partial [Actinomycetota bacterium]|nr:DMT family transporter [Actinomycetota bacterium]
WPRTALWKAVGWSVLGTIVYQLAIVNALRWTSAATAGIILGLEPVIILALESLFLRRLPRRHLVISVALGIVGVVLVVGIGAGSAPHESLGVLLALIAALAWSLYVVGSKPLGSRHGSAGLTAISAVSAGLGLGLLFGAAIPAAARHASTADAAVLAATVLASSLIGFLAWNWGASRTNSSQAGVFLYLVPLFSVIGGAVLLRERLSPSDLAGAAFIIAALITAHRVPESALAVEPGA